MKNSTGSGVPGRDPVGSSSLPPGLYERLIDAELAEALAATQLRAVSSAVDAADAPHVLTTHLAGRIESALSQVDAGERLALANRLLDVLPEASPLREGRPAKPSKSGSAKT